MNSPQRAALVLASLALAGCERERLVVTEVGLVADGVADVGQPAEAAPEPIELEGGVVVQLLRRGEGPRAARGRTLVLTHVARAGEDGAPFDSSGGIPWSLRLGAGPRLLPGLERGLLSLHAGSRARIRVPAALAWGEDQSAPPGVPAGAELVYEVELLEVR